MTADRITWKTTHNDTVMVFPRPRFGRFTGLARGTAWHWNVRAANGEIVGHGEGYSRRIDAVKAAERHHQRVEVES